MIASLIKTAEYTNSADDSKNLHQRKYKLPCTCEHCYLIYSRLNIQRLWPI